MGFLQGGAVNWVLVSLVLFFSRISVIMLIYIPHEKLLKKRLEVALVKGQVSAELSESLSDKVSRNAHIYELAVIPVIIFLMVLKPF